MAAMKHSLKDSVLLIVRSIRSRKTPTTSPTCHCLPKVSAVPEYTFSSFKTKCSTSSTSALVQRTRNRYSREILAVRSRDGPGTSRTAVPPSSLIDARCSRESLKFQGTTKRINEKYRERISRISPDDPVMVKPHFAE